MHAPAIEAFAPLARLVGRGPTRRIRDYTVHVGDGQAVLVLPQFGGGLESTRRLRRLLQESGFAVHDWGLGVDNGPGDGLEPLLRRLEERVIDVFEAERGPVSLLGCGLSGIYAREVAKRATPIVRQVITIGSPVRVRDPLGRCELLKVLLAPASGVTESKLARLRQRPPVPCTSVYSAADEIVPAETAREPESATSENVLVPACRHEDLLRHPKTIEAVTQRLARPDGPWRPSHG